jgi:hypothetical protein
MNCGLPCTLTLPVGQLYPKAARTAPGLLIRQGFALRRCTLQSGWIHAEGPVPSAPPFGAAGPAPRRGSGKKCNLVTNHALVLKQRFPDLFTAEAQSFSVPLPSRSTKPPRLCVSVVKSSANVFLKLLMDFAREPGLHARVAAAQRGLPRRAAARGALLQWGR